MKKVLFLCATSNSVKNFRRGLIRKFQEEGYQVGVSAFDEDNKDLIKSFGVDFFCIKTKNKSLNPFQMLVQKKYYKKLIKEYQPDVVCTFVLKPNTLGVQAAYKVGVRNIYSFVEGAGEVFLNNSFKWKCIRLVVFNWYKRAFKKVKKVFFLNKDDKAEFLKQKLVKEEKCELIHGVGVDLERFAFQPIENKNTFLMIARMLRTKGVMEYCECARRVKKIHPEAVFQYIGAEGSIKLTDIQEYIDDGSIEYLGTTVDVRPYWAACGCCVLPSYREGVPACVMEAEATGRMIITSDTVGCKETVQDGYNGFLVPLKDVDSLVEKCIWVLENPNEMIKMGKNARKFAEEHFDSKCINENIFHKIKISANIGE